jgi:hypothetical protein
MSAVQILLNIPYNKLKQNLFLRTNVCEYKIRNVLFYIEFDVKFIL